MTKLPLKELSFAVVLLALTLPLAAQDWSIGVGAGPFVFGDFVERRLRPVNPDGPEDPVTLTLSAATRPGVVVDLERSFADRWAIRLEGTWTSAPLTVKDETSDDGISIDAGEMDVVTFAVPLVFRINPRGAFRFHIMAGPALAIYEVAGRENSTGVPVPADTRNEWGAVVGGGVAWWLSDRFAVEGNISDTVTSSPFEEVEDSGLPGIDAKRPHNVHTSVGIRWKF